MKSDKSLLWRHNGCDGVSNHQPHDCLLNRSFRRRSKKTSKLRVTGLCVGNSPVTDEFPAQKASDAENASIWWRHHLWRVWHATGHRLSQILLKLNLYCYALQLHNVKIWHWGNRHGKSILSIQITPPAKLWTEIRILCWVPTPVHIRTARTKHGGLLICRRDTQSKRLPSPIGKEPVSLPAEEIPSETGYHHRWVNSQ